MFIDSTVSVYRLFATLLANTERISILHALFPLDFPKIEISRLDADDTLS